MANGKVKNYIARSSATITSGEGVSISVVFYKLGRVCQMRIINGSFTGNAFDALITIPQGFAPLDIVDFKETYSDKRLFLSGNIMYCGETLSSIPLRGSVTYLSAE